MKTWTTEDYVYALKKLKDAMDEVSQEDVYCEKGRPPALDTNSQ